MLPDADLTRRAMQDLGDPRGPAFSIDYLLHRFHESGSLQYVTFSDKALVSHRNGKSNSVSAMSERSWESAKEQWQRVRWARERVFDSAAAAAEALGIPAPTYRQYERSPTSSRSANLNEDYAKSFAKKFRVNWVWLLTGVGAPSGGSLDDASSELLDIYNRLGSQQQELLIALARNMTGAAGNVVTVDSLPSATSPKAKTGRKAG